MAKKQKKEKKAAKAEKRTTTVKTPSVPSRTPPKLSLGATAAAAPAAAKVDTTLTDAILKATDEPKPKKGEDLKAFCYRVFVKMAAVPDDVFKALPKEARDWYDKASDLFNAEKFDEIVALPGMPGAALTVAAAEPQAEAPTAGAKADKKADKAPKASKEPKAPKEKEERKPRTDGLAYQVRIEVVKNPDITFEKLCEKVELKGRAAAPTGHAHNMYQHARHVMTLALANGYEKK